MFLPKQRIFINKESNRYKVKHGPVGAVITIDQSAVCLPPFQAKRSISRKAAFEFANFFCAVETCAINTKAA